MGAGPQGNQAMKDMQRWVHSITHSFEHTFIPAHGWSRGCWVCWNRGQHSDGGHAAYGMQFLCELKGCWIEVAPTRSGQADGPPAFFMNRSCDFRQPDVQAMPLEELDKLMQDSADAKAYVDELNQMLGAQTAGHFHACAARVVAGQGVRGRAQPAAGCANCWRLCCLCGSRFGGPRLRGEGGSGCAGLLVALLLVRLVLLWGGGVRGEAQPDAGCA